MKAMIRFSIILLFLVSGLQAVTAQTPTRLRLKQLELAPDTAYVIYSKDDGTAIWKAFSSVLSAGGGVTGPLTAGRIPRATGTYTLSDGVLRDDGTLLALGGATVSGYSFYDYSTGGWRLATGTAAQRPTNVAGVFRYNTSLGYSETANGSAWLQSDLPVGTSAQTLRHNGTSWIANSVITNDGSIARVIGDTHRFYFSPATLTEGITSDLHFAGLNNAEGAGARMALTGLRFWFRISAIAADRGILIAPVAEATTTATNTMLTTNRTVGYNAIDVKQSGNSLAILSAETGANAHLLLRSNVTTANRGISNYHHQNAVAGASEGFFRSRGTSSSPTALQNGDIIGASVFRPYDGANYMLDNCYFGGSVSGVVSSGNTPSSLFFIAGSTTSYLPDLLIHDSGNVGIGSTGNGDITSAVVAPPQQLTVYGAARITGSDGTATALMGRDADGDISAVSEGYGINVTGGALEVDTTQIATQSDLASVSVTTLYTGDGTIATDRTVTIGSDKTLTITSTTPDFPGYSHTKKIGYNATWDLWGDYSLIYTNDYFTNFIQGIIDYDSTVFIRISAGDWGGDNYVDIQMNSAGVLSLTGISGSSSAGLSIGQNTTLGAYGSRLQGAGGVEFDADTGGKFVFQVNNTTEAVIDATGVGINDTSPEKSLDVGGMGKFRQLSGQDNSVTIGTNANMGTGRSASITGSQSSDVAGRFSFTSGTGLTAGEWVTLTWAVAFDNPPAVQLFPEDGDGASLAGLIYVVPTTTGCSIAVNTNSASYESKTYEFNYIVIQGK